MHNFSRQFRLTPLLLTDVKTSIAIYIKKIGLLRLFINLHRLLPSVIRNLKSLMWKNHKTVSYIL